MPPRKRRSRRKDDVLSEPAPVDAPASDPAPLVSGPVPPQTEVVIPPVVFYLDPRTGRPLHAGSAEGGVVSQRPGDAWRDRFQAHWRRAGTCPSCGKPRKVLRTLSGEAAVCDLLAVVDYLAQLGCCVCLYAAQES